MNLPLHRIVPRAGATPVSAPSDTLDTAPQAAARWVRALASLFAAPTAPARVVQIPAGAMDPTAALLWWTGDADRLAWIELSQPLQPGADPLLRNVRAALRLAARLPASWSQGHPLIWADGAACRAACASIEDPICLQVEVPGLRLRLWGARQTLSQWPDVVPEELPTDACAAEVAAEVVPEVAPEAAAEIAAAAGVESAVEAAAPAAAAVEVPAAEVPAAEDPFVVDERQILTPAAGSVPPAAARQPIFEAVETLVQVRPTPTQLGRRGLTAAPDAAEPLGGTTTHVMDREALDQALDALRGRDTPRQKQNTAQ